MHRSHQTGFLGKGSDHLQLIKFWPSRAPGRASAVGRKFLAPPYYSQRAVFASPLSAFSFTGWIPSCRLTMVNSLNGQHNTTEWSKETDLVCTHISDTQDLLRN